METLNAGFECKNMLESDNAFHVEGYASVYGNVDLGDDIVDHGSFSGSVSKNIPLLLSHDTGAVPIGTIDEMREDNFGLFFKASMPKSDTRVSDQIYPQLKHGSLKGVSVGFITKAREFLEVEGKQIRKITKADLLEISLTAIGMNPKALVTDVKSLGFSELDGMTVREKEQLFKGFGFSKELSKHLTAALRDVGGDQGQRDAGDQKSATNEALSTLLKTTAEDISNGRASS